MGKYALMNTNYVSLNNITIYLTIFRERPEENPWQEGVSEKNIINYITNRAKPHYKDQA